MEKKVPKHWPIDLTFLGKLEYQATELPMIQVPLLKIQSSRCCSLVVIKSITDPNHPSYPQCGLFAAGKIKKGQHILDYRGIVYHESQVSCRSDYVIHFVQEYSIDAEKAGNEARFVNDFRGISDKPNVKFDLYRNSHGELCMGLFSLMDIGKGKELLVSYGKGFWKHRFPELIHR